MANPERDQNGEEPSAKSRMGLVGAIGLFVVSAIAGICLPIYLPDLFAAAEPHEPNDATHEFQSRHDGMTYVQFGEVTVNLDEGRMNRYLRIKMSLQVKEQEKEQRRSKGDWTKWKYENAV